MSDHYITITASKEIDNPERIMDKVIEWMQFHEFIERELTDCVMSSKNKGYRPGKNHVSAIGYDENILRLSVCGVEVKTRREVFNAGAFTAMTRMACPNCGRNRFEGIKPQDFFSDNCTEEQMELFKSVFSVFEKWTSSESASLTCPHCGKRSEIEAYEIDNSISLSNFGLTFWNWADLTNEFLAQLRSMIGAELNRINGHL